MADTQVHFVVSVVITFHRVSQKRLFSESRELLVGARGPRRAWEHLLHSAVAFVAVVTALEVACLTWRARLTSFNASTAF